LAKIIAVSNQKGGVGKTTTSVNLAACLGMAGKRVLLVDFDPQGNATSGCGVDKKELENTVYQVIIEEQDPRELIIHTEYALDLLPANIDLAGAEIELIEVENREQRLKQSLDILRDSYDYIIIDCPPSLGLLTLNSLTAADSVLMPLQCEFYALEGMTQLMNTIELIQQETNPQLTIEGVLLTMYDSRTRLSMEVAGEVRKYFGEKVYETMIPRTVRLSEAPSYGMPIVFYDKSCKGSEVYQSFTQEVIAHEQA